MPNNPPLPGAAPTAQLPQTVALPPLSTAEFVDAVNQLMQRGDLQEIYKALRWSLQQDDRFFLARGAPVGPRRTLGVPDWDLVHGRFPNAVDQGDLAMQLHLSADPRAVAMSDRIHRLLTAPGHISGLQDSVDFPGIPNDRLPWAIRRHAPGIFGLAQNAPPPGVARTLRPVPALDANMGERPDSPRPTASDMARYYTEDAALGAPLPVVDPATTPFIGEPGGPMLHTGMGGRTSTEGSGISGSFITQMPNGDLYSTKPTQSRSELPFQHLLRKMKVPSPLTIPLLGPGPTGAIQGDPQQWLHTPRGKAGVYVASKLVPGKQDIGGFYATTGTARGAYKKVLEVFDQLKAQGLIDPAATKLPHWLWPYIQSKMAEFMLATWDRHNPGNTLYTPGDPEEVARRLAQGESLESLPAHLKPNLHMIDTSGYLHDDDALKTIQAWDEKVEGLLRGEGYSAAKRQGLSLVSDAMDLHTTVEPPTTRQEIVDLIAPLLQGLSEKNLEDAATASRWKTGKQIPQIWSKHLEPRWEAVARLYERLKRGDAIRGVPFHGVLPGAAPLPTAKDLSSARQLLQELYQKGRSSLTDAAGDTREWAAGLRPAAPPLAAEQVPRSVAGGAAGLGLLGGVHRLLSDIAEGRSVDWGDVGTSAGLGAATGAALQVPDAALALGAKYLPKLAPYAQYAKMAPILGDALIGGQAASDMAASAGRSASWGEVMAGAVAGAGAGVTPFGAPAMKAGAALSIPSDILGRWIGSGAQDTRSDSMKKRLGEKVRPSFPGSFLLEPGMRETPEEGSPVA